MLAQPPLTPSLPTATFVHAPVVQSLQGPGHSVLQQCPSEAKPLAQFAGFVSLWPFSLRHVPLAEHVCVPVHSGGSSVPVDAAPATTRHWPLELPQFRHGVVHVLSQHTPSTQPPALLQRSQLPLW